MPGVPPNPDLADLVALLGEDNVRILIRTFLAEYPQLLRQLGSGNRATRHRMTHSLKTNARVMGARDLSARMLAFEVRLNQPSEPDLSPAEISDIEKEFHALGGMLAAFAGAA